MADRPAGAPTGPDFDQVLAQYDEPDVYTDLAKLYRVSTDDPRIYKIAGKLLDKGINLREFIASKTGEGGAPGAHPTPRDGSDLRHARRQPAPDEVKPEDYHVSHAVGPLGLLDNDKRRELERGVAQGLMFGSDVLPRLADKISGLAGSTDMSPEQAQKDAETAPGYNSAGRIVGSVAGAPRAVASRTIGAAERLGRAFVRPAGRLSNAAVSSAAAVASVPVIGGETAAAGHVIDSATGGGGQELTEDGQPSHSSLYEATKKGARDSINPANVGMAFLFGGASGLARGIHDSPGQTGQDIRLGERFNARPSIMNGLKGPVFEEGPLAGRGTTAAEIGDIARGSGEQIRHDLNTRNTAAQTRYGQAETAARDAGMNSSRVDVTDELFAAVGHVANDARIPAGVRTQLRQTLQDELVNDPLLRDSWHRAAHPAPGRALGPAAMGDPGWRLRLTPEQLNHVRQRMAAISEERFGGAGGPAGPIVEALRTVENTTPYEDIKAPYAAEMEALKADHRNLGMGERTHTEMTDTKAGKSIAATLRRKAEDSFVSGQERQDVEAYEHAHPEHALPMNAAGLQMAKGRLTPQIKAPGAGLYNKVQGLVARNLEPAEAGLLYPLSRYLGAGRSMPGLIGGDEQNIILQAAEARRKREDARARMLRGESE